MPTVRDIPPVVLTNIQRVEDGVFESYISQVGALYEQVQRVKDNEDEAWARRDTKSDNLLKGYEDSRKDSEQSHSPQKRFVASIPSVTTWVSLSRKGHHHSPPPLSTIPSIYFDEAFHLENPRTFDIASERSDVVPLTSATADKATNRNDTAPKKAIATNAILQEKISWYMDTVEIHLINSISIASTSFFSALDSLRELHSEVTESVEGTKTLRQNLAFLNKDIVTNGLELLQVRKKSQNLQQLNDAVLQMKRIIEAVTHSNDLTSLRFRIGKIFESRVHSLLIEDLRRHVQSLSAQEVLFRWGTVSLRAKGVHTEELSAFPTYMSMTDELRIALVPSISGLYCSSFILEAIQSYRELVLGEIRNIVRKSLPSSTEDTESISGGARSGTKEEKSSILSRNIRALNANNAEKLFSTIYFSIAETLRRLKTQSSVLLDIACALENPDSGYSEKSPVTRPSIRSLDIVGNASIFKSQEEMHAALDLPNLLRQAVDVSHEKIIKILQVRSEQVTSLPHAHFLRYFTLNLFFVNECEAISGREGSSLKTIVNSHIRDFSKAYSDREIQALAKGMNVDDWQERDFTAHDNEILKHILACSTSDPLAWTDARKIWAPLSPGEIEETDGTKVSDINTTAKGKVRGATIEEETFLLPYSAILCLRGASRFLHLMSIIPSITPDIATLLISYLRMFDSRCRQLVLGGGATRSAGLKKITAKHLALASQALMFIATIITHIREFVWRHVPAGPPSANLMSKFDEVRRALQEQQDSIYQKLVDIMEFRALILSKKARETHWGRESTEGVRKSMVDLAKDTGALFNALSKYMPERAVELVMVPVFTSYREHLGKAFSESNPETEIGRDCMLHDVEFLVSKLGTVSGFGDLGMHLMKIVRDKDIKVIPNKAVISVRKDDEGKNW